MFGGKEHQMSWEQQNSKAFCPCREITAWVILLNLVRLSSGIIALQRFKIPSDGPEPRRHTKVTTYILR